MSEETKKEGLVVITNKETISLRLIEAFLSLNISLIDITITFLTLAESILGILLAF